MVAAPDVGGTASSAVLQILQVIVDGWLLVVLGFFFLPCLPLFPSLPFQLFSLFLRSSCSFLFTWYFFITAHSLVCWLAYISFWPAYSLRLALDGPVTLLYSM